MAATVLLCDGSAFVRDLFGDALEGAGWTVVARVGTGEAALAAARTHRPQVVVLDLLFPDRDGLELLSELRGLSPSPALVVCTGVADAAVRAVCLAAGASSVVTKPLSPARIAEALRGVAR